MLYAFVTIDPWEQPATIVAAADSLDEYNAWVETHARNSEARNETYFEQCRPITLMQKMRDKRFNGFRHYLMEFSHASITQRDRFIALHHISVLSNDVAREKHQAMSKKDVRRWEDHAGPGHAPTIAELIGEQQTGRYAPRDQAKPENQTSQSPIDVVGINRKDDHIAINATYRGTNYTMRIPDSVKGASRETLLSQYHHYVLPDHKLPEAMIVKIAEDALSPDGWYFFVDPKTVICKFRIDLLRIEQGIHRAISDQIKAETMRIIDLDALRRSRIEKALLPQAIMDAIPNEDVECTRYPTDSEAGDLLVIPSANVIATHNCELLQTILLAGNSAACYRVNDLANDAFLLHQIGNEQVLVVRLRKGAA